MLSSEIPDKYYQALRNVTPEVEQIDQEIQQEIEYVSRNIRSLYWNILESTPDQLDGSYLGMLETAMHYMSVATEEYRKKSPKLPETFNDSRHTMYHSSNRGGSSMSRYFASLPLLRLEDIKNNWNNLIHIHTSKALFTLVGSVCTLLLGSFTDATWVLIVLSCAHLIMRLIAQSKHSNVDYSYFSRNIGLFFMPYFWLAIANTLSYIISINILPSGSFVALAIAWLIFSELKGTIDAAKAAGIPVPSFLERLTSGRNNSGSEPPL